jgi:uncharacterized protein YkwD
MVRAVAVVVAVAASLVVAAPASAVSGADRTVQAANTLELGVLAQVNRVRAEHGLKPLRINVKLRAAADAHSLAMGSYGFFAHESRDGSSFWKRVERFYGPKGFAFWSVGENLLWSSGELSPEAAVQMWMNSPKHRENMLTARWREIGLSAVTVPAGPGTFGGLDVTILTADFGVRKSF